MMETKIFVSLVLIVLLYFGSFSFAKQKKKKQPKVCECGISRSAKLAKRIVRMINGDIVHPPYKYPWMVSILRDKRHICGGVIISERHILTAAHCFVKQECFKPSAAWLDCYVRSEVIQITQMFNSPSHGTNYSIESIIGHPKFNAQNVSYDIALLKTDKKMHCSMISAPICLPSLRLPALDRAGTKGIAAGWGQSVSGPYHVSSLKLLRESHLQIQHNKCGNIPDGLKTHFCASSDNQNTCWGDSGGPLFVEYKGRNYVVGISSFGTDPFCSDSKEFFTRVRLFLPWIKKQIRY